MSKCFEGSTVNKMMKYMCAYINYCTPQRKNNNKKFSYFRFFLLLIVLVLFNMGD